MSYILDALKKSDRERQRHHPTSLATPQSEFSARRRPGRALAVPLLIVALVLAAAGGGALLAMHWRQAQPSEADSDAATPAPLVTEERVPANASTADPSPAPPLAAEPVEDISSPAVALLELWQLTEAEQEYLSALEVSFHVYSSESSQRTVIVNGLRAGEGQSLGQDLRLLEITADGMIVEFQGKQVRMVTVQPI